MRDEVAGLAAQLKWQPSEATRVAGGHDALVVCGMGGSAMAGAAAALISPLPVTLHRGYGLPATPASNPLVVATSYSGNTAETLASLRAAEDAGLEAVVISSGGAAADQARARGWPLVLVPGGLQPRAALGYQAAAIGHVIEAATGTDVTPHLVETADLLENHIASGGAGSIAKDLAGAVGRAVPVIVGAAGPGFIAAYRWKTQINENSKRPAFALEIPEANHNDLQGWHGPDGGAGFALVVLHDEGADSRLRRRMELTGTTLSSRLAVAGEVRSAGSSPLARFFTLAIVGDLLSLSLADAAGLDPTPVAALEAFKQSLEEKP